MAVIGNFTRGKDGGWEGTIRTLSATVRARFVPNDDRSNSAAPDFHITTAKCELGAAWIRRRADRPAEYLSVQLDDPAFEKPLSAALFYNDDASSAQLVWNRRHQGGCDA
jgi:uncharacterized protein (DUF736 family)